MYSIIYSADFKFQVLNITRANYKTSWDIANEMQTEGVFKEHKIEHYDVISFDGIDEMNGWILERVEQSRVTKKSQAKPTKLEQQYPLLLERYDKLNCIICEKLCYPDAKRANGTIVYNRHKCKGEYEFSATMRSFEIDIDGDLVEE